MKFCLFCQSGLVSTSNHRQQKTREHIFPKWLLEEQKQKQEKLSFSFLEAHSDDDVSLQLTPPKISRTLSLNSFLLGNICAECNNGWMSDLGNSCKDDLKNLLSGETKIDNRLALAVWCVKTAFVLSSYLKPNVGALPEKWSRELYKKPSQLPLNCAVFAKSLSKSRYWFSIPSTHEIQAISQIQAEEVWQKSAKVVFQLGCAAFQVVWSSGANYLTHYPSDSILLQSSIPVSPIFGASVKDAGISDELFVFMMSNGLVA